MKKKKQKEKMSRSKRNWPWLKASQTRPWVRCSSSACSKRRICQLFRSRLPFQSRLILPDCLPRSAQTPWNFWAGISHGYALQLVRRASHRHRQPARVKEVWREWVRSRKGRRRKMGTENWIMKMNSTMRRRERVWNRNQRS